MGSLVADSMPDRVRRQDIQIAIANSGGMRAPLDEDEVTVGRIREVLVGDAPIDPEAAHGAVTNDFVRNGGDGYCTFATDVHDHGPDLADVLVGYMAAHGPVMPKVEGRISRLERSRARA